jgi:membrane associated rhomboid family serine protease
LADTVHFFNSTQWRWRRLRWQRQLDDLLHGRMRSGGLNVTQLLIATNILFFLAMVVIGMATGRGLSPVFNPDTELLVHAGAQYWPLVIYHGEWWRCITYAYTHGGIIHIGFNMLVLYQVGPLIESELGAARYLVLYTLTALTATGLGYLWHPMVPVVGASGSLFGLIGFAVAWYHRMGPSGHHIRNFMFRWAAFAFIFGLVVGADNAGHLGGGLGGALLGLVMPLGVRGRQALAPLFNVLALLCLAATLGSLGLLVASWFTATGGV